MWGRLLFGAALVFAPGAALACSCEDARQFSRHEVEKAARYLIDGGFVVADVERIDDSQGGPQRFAVRRVLVGTLQASLIDIPASTRLLPAGQSDGVVTSSCDTTVAPGFKGRLVLTSGAAGSGPPGCSVFRDAGLRIAGLCTNGLLNNPAILRRAAAIEQAQAGVRRSSRPLSSSR
nr:hypothetical protein [uncultured Sphingomonas sp.]